MKMRLSGVATVRAGVAFREAVRHVEGGPMAVVQAGDVLSDGTLDLSTLLRITGVEGRSPPQELTAGDVLLQSRGQSYRAAVVPEHDLPTIPTASVLVITTGPLVQPAYLAHFLNDPATQTGLRKLATGATIANLKRSVVEELEVLIPSLEDQERIVALGESLKELSRLEARIAELRRIELRALLEERARRNRKRSCASGS